ncbi:MAG: hypothetical protein HQM08_12965 [Candidatus Riflebacteria bacterium]|nr:hypothetical protein [Candidatus Riflebacteria bacterium]
MNKDYSFFNNQGDIMKKTSIRFLNIFFLSILFVFFAVCSWADASKKSQSRPAPFDEGLNVKIKWFGLTSTETAELDLENDAGVEKLAGIKKENGTANEAGIKFQTADDVLYNGYRKIRRTYKLSIIYMRRFLLNLKVQIANDFGVHFAKPIPATPATGTPNIAEIVNLKAEMFAKFGVRALDGDGATWSKRQLEEAIKVLQKLPPAFVQCTKNIQRDGMFQSDKVLGYVKMGTPTVHIMNSACIDGTFQGTLCHEMTHCYQSNNPKITSTWKNQFWADGIPQPPSVTPYGDSEYLEDFAESVRMYYIKGAKMKKTQPERYEFIKTNVMNGQEFA